MTVVPARAEAPDTTAALLPLVRRFPALGAVPRVSLGGGRAGVRVSTPVESADALAPGLWIKRDDLAGESFGGNKVRALEFLLGGVRAGDRVITVGARGSTHVLATVICARELGAHVSVFRWPQEMNAAAEQVARRIEVLADRAPVSWSTASAFVRAAVARLRGGRWIPAGGSTPLGILGAVNAGLELGEQVAAGVLPAPRRIVVPLGSGGTAAGLLLGTYAAGLTSEIVAVRVVPRIVANRRRVLRLTHATARLIAEYTREWIAPPGTMLRVVHGYYGGAYGRVSSSGTAAAERCARHSGAVVDPTYTAKALAAAIEEAGTDRGPTLFWLTFDARMTRDASVVEPLPARA